MRFKPKPKFKPKFKDYLKQSKWLRRKQGIKLLIHKFSTFWSIKKLIPECICRRMRARSKQLLIQNQEASYMNNFPMTILTNSILPAFQYEKEHVLQYNLKSDSKIQKCQKRP
jgi:hypothetical protein